MMELNTVVLMRPLHIVDRIASIFAYNSNLDMQKHLSEEHNSTDIDSQLKSVSIHCCRANHQPRAAHAMAGTNNVSPTAASNVRGASPM